MPFTLELFAQQAPPALLREAVALERAHHVHNLTRDGIEMLATVHDPNAGPEGVSFDVAIAIGPKGELLAICSCDDEAHELCRHALATLLAAMVQEHAMAPASSEESKTGAAAAGEETAAPAPKKRGRPPGKATTGKSAKKGAGAQLRTVLEAAPHAALVDVLIKISKRDKLMQNQILLEVTDVAASTESWRTAVRAALHPRGGWQHWMDDRIVRAGKKQINTLTERIDLAISQGDIDRALQMAVVVLEEIAPIAKATEYISVVMDFGDHAFDVITAHGARASEAARDELFRGLVTIVEAYHRESLDAASLLELLAGMVKTTDERKIVESHLMAPAAELTYIGMLHDKGMSQTANNYMKLRHGLILRLDGEDAAVAFAKENVDYNSMRNSLIERAVAAQDWQAVTALAGEGLRRTSSYPQLAYAYRSYLIRAAQAQGDPASKQLEAQFLAARRLEDYVRWKESVPPDEWPAARAQALASSRMHVQSLYEILVYEEAWGDMMKWLLETKMTLRGMLDILEQNGAALVERFPDDVARWCIRAIEALMQSPYPNRDDYRLIAAILGQMKTLGLAKESMAEAALLREIYPKRRAMLQELAYL